MNLHLNPSELEASQWLAEMESEIKKGTVH